MLPTVTLTCPYCGECFDTAVDCSAGNQQYIEDCPVCCRPIEMDVHTDEGGALCGVTTRREDE